MHCDRALTPYLSGLSSVSCLHHTGRRGERRRERGSGSFTTRRHQSRRKQVGAAGAVATRAVNLHTARWAGAAVTSVSGVAAVGDVDTVRRSSDPAPLLLTPDTRTQPARPQPPRGRPARHPVGPPRRPGKTLRRRRPDRWGTPAGTALSHSSPSYFPDRHPCCHHHAAAPSL